LSLGHVLVDELVLVISLKVDVSDESEVLKWDLLEGNVHDK